jgi:hypothetical protein
VLNSILQPFLGFHEMLDLDALSCSTCWSKKKRDKYSIKAVGSDRS